MPRRRSGDPLFRFVSHHASEYGVKRMCKGLKVSRSGYYDWKRRPPSAHATRDAELKTLICEIHQRTRTSYGAPRVHAELRPNESAWYPRILHTLEVRMEHDDEAVSA